MFFFLIDISTNIFEFQLNWIQARRQWGGALPPRFSFLPHPPDLFLAPPRYFFWEEKVAVFGRKKG